MEFRSCEIIHQRQNSQTSYLRKLLSLQHFPLSIGTSHLLLNVLFFNLAMPTSLAHLDARPTCDQEVAGSTPSGSATFFRGDVNMEYFPLV